MICSAAGVKDETFFSLSDSDITKLLKDYPNLLIDFVLKYSFEKGLILVNNSQSPVKFCLEHMETDENDSSLINTDSLNETNEKDLNVEDAESVILPNPIPSESSGLYLIIPHLIILCLCYMYTYSITLNVKLN